MPSALKPAYAVVMAHHTTAHYFLEGLVEIGIDYLFCNLGTDHATLIDELARWRQQGRQHPPLILCPHENVAIHMAGAYAALTGRGQAVLVHVDAGTANAAMGLHNLFRSRLPVLLFAGKSPYTLHGELPGSRDNYVHFIQDPFDMASLVRPYVKWDYNLPSGVVAKEALQRASSVMHSAPCGPVYMTLPRETLAQTWDDSVIQSYPATRFGSVPAQGLTPAQADAVALRLINAQSPIAITSYLGRNPAAVGALDALAQAVGMAVYESSPTYLCMPRSSPCFAGFDALAALKTTDVGLLLDVDVPWLPKAGLDNPATHWTQLDVDALKKDFPMWGFAAHERHSVDCAVALAQVLESVNALTSTRPEFAATRAARMLALAERKARRLAAAEQAAQDAGGHDALNAAHVCAQLNLALKSDDIVINEAIRNSPAVLNQIQRDLPLTLMGSAGGGLGYSGGMALGARLASPKARVIQIVGDGGFHFGAPTAVYAVAQQYALPIFTLVLDNGGWQAVKEATLRMHPDGPAAQVNEFQSRLGGAVRNFAQVGEAFGAHGETVSDPAELTAAIARCLAAVDNGQAAVLVARLKSI
jgi:acetolactate synthase I/II/III large subunit